MAVFDIGAVEDLERGPMVVAIGYVDLIVWRVDGAILVTDRFCPHARGDLSTCTPAGGEITCGDHGWNFRLADGGCVKKPGRYTLPTYPATLRDGRIEVELPADAPTG